MYNHIKKYMNKLQITTYSLRFSKIKLWILGVE